MTAVHDLLEIENTETKGEKIARQTDQYGEEDTVQLPTITQDLFQ